MIFRDVFIETLVLKKTGTQLIAHVMVKHFMFVQVSSVEMRKDSKEDVVSDSIWNNLRNAYQEACRHRNNDFSHRSASI